jgi:hypothetical protein
LVIVTTSVRSSPGDSAVLMRPSVLVFNFKPELSTTHVQALSHFKSQSGPAWHVICCGIDTLKSPATSEQLQAPKRTPAVSTSRRYRIKFRSRPHCKAWRDEHEPRSRRRRVPPVDRFAALPPLRRGIARSMPWCVQQGCTVRKLIRTAVTQLPRPIILTPKQS